MKKTLLMLAALLCCFTLKAQQNYDFTDNSTGQTIYYRITDAEQHTVSIVAPHSDISMPWEGFEKPTGEISLPQSVEYNNTSYTVTGIGTYAFLSCNGLTGQLIIPDGVTSIGVSAFYGCSGFTGSLTIPNSVKIIEQEAFMFCEGLSGMLNIGSSIEKIRHWAFAHTGFRYAGFRATTPPTFGNDPFQGTPNTLIQAIAVPEGYADAYKTALSEYADKITGVVLQDHCLFVSSSNEDMGSASMTSHEGANVTVTATPNVGCWFEKWTENGVQVSTSNPYSFSLDRDRFLVANFGSHYDFADNSTGQTLYYRITDTEHCFVKLVAPNGDNSNGWNGFTKPTGEFTLSGNVNHNSKTYTVTEIGNYAFYNCEGLTGSLTIPNTVTSIAKSAFEGCSGMTGTLTLGNSIVSIGQDTFKNCKFTGQLALPESVETIDIAAFYGCKGFTGTLVIPNSVKTIKANAFQECSGFTGSLVIPNSVTSIWNHAFYKCSGFIGALTLGNSLESISYDAFNECCGLVEVINLSSLNIVKGSTDNGYAAYYALSVITDPSESKLEEEGDFVFFIEEANYLVGYKGNATQLTLPESFRGENYAIYKNVFKNRTNFTGSLIIPNSVTSIGESAFEGCRGFTSLTIGTSVESIESGAFYGCSGFTGSLAIPNSVTSIGVVAFHRCSGFTSLTIGTSVENIEPGAFYGCSGFTGSLTIPNSVENIGEEAFADCSGFTGSLTIGSSVSSIGESAFENCSGFTGSLTIPNSVKSIGVQAFYGCYSLIGTLTIGSSVESIADGAFYECVRLFEVINLSDLDIVKGATTHGYAAYYAMTVKDSGPASEIVNYGDFIFFISDGNNYLVDYKGNSTQLVLPDSYEGQNYAIGNYAFPGRDNFTGSLIIPESVTSIGDYAFVDCSGFTGSLIIPESVTSIGNSAFAWCSGFTGSLTIPNSVTSIGNSAFEYCSGMKGTLTIGNSVKSIGDAAFNQCSFKGSLTIPNSVESIGNSAFYYCEHLFGTLRIGSSVTSIGEQAFIGCYRLVEVINDSHLEIEKGATTHGYAACYALSVKGSGATSEIVNFGDFVFFSADETNHLIGYTGNDTHLTLPASYHDEDYVIYERAFWECGNFAGSLIIPETVTSIGKYAFYYCDCFTGPLVIPNSVKSIDYRAFLHCVGFCGSLTIGSSVESIGEGAFGNCDFDNIISKAKDAPSLSSHISNNTNIVYVPSGTIASYETAWAGHDYTFIEYDGGSYHFNGTTDNNWSTSTNWEENQVPAQNSPLVFINADCQVNTNAEVGAVNVAAGKTLTVNQNCTLTADGIILEEGAQLIDNGSMECSNYTIMKDIAGYGTGTGNWYLISSPVDKNDFYWIPGVLTYPEDTYDLYRFEQAGDEEGNEWINRKYVEEVYDVEFGLENQRGYLYANKNGTTILFRGGLAATASKHLEYVEGVDFPGFNLVGNPYPCNATISGTNLRSENYFYMMNAGGTALEVVASPVIAPCTGVFAVAADSDATVTFTQADATANVTRGEKSALRDVRVELLANGKVIDRAYLNTNGESLPKFRLQDNGSEICFYQNKEDLAVASTGSAHGEMPLNFKAEKNGSYTITVNTANVEAQYLHLIDNMTGMDTDLLSTSSYTFNASTSDYAYRFKLVFSVKDTEPAEATDTFAFISNGEIIVSNEGRATLQVIDVMGRIVSSEEINGECRISTNGMTAGLYILNLDGKTQKIVVE